VEREVVLSGIGGQGIQLCAQVLARAALAEGRHVQLFGSYGGMMRGGNTEATMLVADDPIEGPPTVSSTWSAVLMHHEHSETVLRVLRPGSLVFLNTTVFEAPVDWSPYALVEVPATALAADSTGIQTASMVMLGAYAAVTGLVAVDSLGPAITDALPSYRAQHAARNVDAVAVGASYCASLAGSHPAWSTTAVAAVAGVPT
jgi:Pyruvate/2-oxoacid:ferredoxin oxidoreductase gamma subunit